MPDLDQRLDAAIRELRAELEPIQLAPPSRLIRRHSRRRIGSILASVLAVGSLGAAVATVARDSDGTNPTSNGETSDRVADALLYPSEMIGGTPDEVMFGPRYGYGPRALLSAPDGTLFVVTLTERFGTQLTPETERRTFNARTYAVEPQGGELGYTSVDACTALSIRQSSPDARPFDSNASELLQSLEVAQRHATLTLPDGWTSFGIGRVGTLIQIAFHSPVGGGNDQFNLMQLPDSSVAMLIGLAGAPITQTSLNGQPAWTATSEFTSLAWQDGPNAVLLYSDTGSLNELEQVVATLQHGDGHEFEGFLANSEPSSGAPSATLPTEDTLASTQDQPNASLELCGAPQLTIV